jgi:hypothetical protein
MNNQPHPTTSEHRELVLRRLAELWELNACKRLGQLIANLARPTDEYLPESEYMSQWRRRIFNIYDLDLVKIESNDEQQK